MISITINVMETPDVSFSQTASIVSRKSGAADVPVVVLVFCVVLLQTAE